MNLYKITSLQPLDTYETFASAVVAAETPEAACAIHPISWVGNVFSYSSERLLNPWGDTRLWASSPEQVRAVLIGVAKPGTEEGVICASYTGS